MKKKKSFQETTRIKAMKTMTTLDHLNATEQLGHMIIDGIAAFAKAVVTIIFVLARGAFVLGQMARARYEQQETLQAINACKALAAAQTLETEYNVLEDGVEVLITPAPSIEEVNAKIDAEIVELDTKLQEIMDVQILEQQFEVATIHNIDEISYVKTGKGRCKKGYRKIGDRCVMIEFADEYKQTLA